MIHRIFGTRAFAPLAVMVPLAFAGSAANANLISNGGFETGDLSGWTRSGDLSFSGVASGFSNSGVFAAFFGPDPLGSIAQTFSTSAASTYQVQFSLALDDGAAPNSFSWSWNGATQLALSDASTFGYRTYTTNVLGAAGVTTLRFDFGDPQSFWLLDDVSVNAVAAVPEPSNVALMLLGLIGAGGMRIAARRARR